MFEHSSFITMIVSICAVQFCTLKYIVLKPYLLNEMIKYALWVIRIVMQ